MSAYDMRRLPRPAFSTSTPIHNGIRSEDPVYRFPIQVCSDFPESFQEKAERHIINVQPPPQPAKYTCRSHPHHASRLLPLLPHCGRSIALHPPYDSKGGYRARHTVLPAHSRSAENKVPSANPSEAPCKHLCRCESNENVPPSHSLCSTSRFHGFR